MKTKKATGFYPLARHRLVWSIVIIVAILVTMNPYSYQLEFKGTALINWMLLGIMALSFVIILYDLLKVEVKDPAAVNETSKTKEFKREVPFTQIEKEGEMK
ncbi:MULTISPECIES: hypothetical protein [unclassified Planococcus (in: firmicutes)]|uniref:hypothetical protein n=1 Tax=unclassified Planococcus (in: firmicutes) TaxID=2662419 RepID=UPI001F488604|nr:MULTISPECIES: hypothetical protein [unclassified Planococcus (in: firmicutes)]UJF26704.1 hypothetical protein L0M13_16450 [Planococcus sp. 107-1]GKW45915.1 hypothetical protein NCCP2050_16070 [Planococcus sp. NCCP-2050]